MITRLLLNRGIDTRKKVEKFLNTSENDLLDPFLFENMEKVVERIKVAKLKKEKIVIYGDYDVDGISGVAYLVIMLRKLGLNIDYYIPNRVHEGFGINRSTLNFLKRRDTKLFITVDISINSREEIMLLKKNGIDIIVTDHHRQPFVMKWKF